MGEKKKKQIGTKASAVNSYYEAQRLPEEGKRKKYSRECRLERKIKKRI